MPHPVHTLNCPPDCTQHDAAVPAGKARLLWTALITIGLFSAVELAVSLSSRSLALTAEAVHMLSDCGSLVLALLATWIARLPASNQAPFGYRRVEILAALVNGLGLVAIALWVGSQALMRLQTPSDDILGLPMLIMATIGLGVNTLNALMLHDHSHHDLNLKGAFLHMVADAVSSIGVILAAIAVWAFHWNWADGAVSLLVAGLILAGAIPLLRQSVDVLLEKTPSHLDLDRLNADLLSVEGVIAVENLRVWAIAPGQETLTVQLVVNLPTGDERDRCLRQIQTSLQTNFGIADPIIQMTAPTLPKPISLSVPASLELVIND